jgi:hypothetical protein
MQFAHNKRMPALQIRDLPASVHRQLGERAKREHSSIAQPATVLSTEATRGLTAAPREPPRSAYGSEPQAEAI